MALSLPQLKNIIDSGSFDQLVGEVEGQILDAKEQPYQFSAGIDAKRELAKDVSAFANTSGGCILIGLPTRISENHSGEEILKPRPIPRTQFDADQYRKILSEWLHPQPNDVDVAFVQHGSDPDKGIGVVFVPAQDIAKKPFLITRTLGDKKSTELTFGYVERRLDATEVFSVVKLQQALRTGMHFEAELLGRIQNLESLIERHFNTISEKQTIKELDTSMRKRIARTLDCAPLQGSAALVLYAVPVGNNEVQSIFSDRPDSIRRKLESPPSIRSQGWGLDTGAPARFVEGVHLRVESYREVVDLYRDGCLVLAGVISNEFLAWADNSSSRIHPLALIELITNFANFFQLVLNDLRSPPKQLKFGIELNGLQLNGVKISLPEGPINPMGLIGHNREAPKDTWNWSITIEGDYNPERIAFQLARELYVWFGHSDEAIPYTKGAGENQAIDIDQIARIG